MLTTDMQEHASLGACTEHEFVIVYCRCDIIHHDMVVAAHTHTTHPDPLLLKTWALPRSVDHLFPAVGWGASFRLQLLKTADVLVLIELKERETVVVGGGGGGGSFLFMFFPLDVGGFSSCFFQFGPGRKKTRGASAV